MAGFANRKKARLRQQTSKRLCIFFAGGLRETRIDDIVQTLEISQPRFPYFPQRCGIARSGTAARLLAKAEA